MLGCYAQRAASAAARPKPGDFDGVGCQHGRALRGHPARRMGRALDSAHVAVSDENFARADRSGRRWRWPCGARGWWRWVSVGPSCGDARPVLSAQAAAGQPAAASRLTAPPAKRAHGRSSSIGRPSAVASRRHVASLTRPSPRSARLTESREMPARIASARMLIPAPPAALRRARRRADVSDEASAASRSAAYRATALRRRCGSGWRPAGCARRSRRSRSAKLIRVTLRRAVAARAPQARI